MKLKADLVVAAFVALRVGFGVCFETTETLDGFMETQVTEQDTRHVFPFETESMFVSSSTADADSFGIPSNPVNKQGDEQEVYRVHANYSGNTEENVEEELPELKFYESALRKERNARMAWLKALGIAAAVVLIFSLLLAMKTGASVFSLFDKEKYKQGDFETTQVQGTSLFFVSMYYAFCGLTVLGSSLHFFYNSSTWFVRLLILAFARAKLAYKQDQRSRSRAAGNTLADEALLANEAPVHQR